MRRLPFAQVRAAAKALLEHCGYAETCADILAHNCLCALRDGIDGHGLFRLQDYMDSLASGYVNGNPRPVLEDCAPAFLRADGDNGFTQITLAQAKAALIEKARRCGIAALAIRNAHHGSSLALDVEPFARQGFIALTFVNSFAVVTPPGGKQAVYGTNPLAFAVPRENATPLLLDMATAVTSYGAVQRAAHSGGTLPAHAGLDGAGQPTDNPQAILQGGTLLPFGGYKGAGLALLVEVLCAALGGGDFSFEVNDKRPKNAPTARTGQTLLLIEPRCGSAALPEFGARIERLVRALQEAGAHIPGAGREQARKKAPAHELMLEAAQVRYLHNALKKRGMHFPRND